MTVGMQHEGAVIVGVILRPKSGRAVVAALQTTASASRWQAFMALSMDATACFIRARSVHFIDQPAEVPPELFHVRA
jgi:hypothetical protein